MTSKTISRAALAAIFFAASGIGSAMAFDVDPYSYSQAPDGTSSIQLVGSVRESTNYQFSGTSASFTKAGNAANSRAITEVGMLHYTGFYEFHGVMIDPHVIVPYASINHTKLSGFNLNGSTGWGDPMVAIVVAPIHAPDNSQIFGFGFGAYLPLGHYEKGQTINVGENRLKSVIQVAGSQEVYPGWHLTGTFDTTFYGDNSEGGTGKQVVSQEKSYQFQPWLRYKPIREFSIALGYSQIFGGKQFLNNIEDGVETNVRQIRLDMATELAPYLFAAMQVSRDIAVEGGFRESFRINTRITTYF